MAWTSSNPVSIGDPTKKSHYDLLFDNILIGRASATGEVITAGNTTDEFVVTGELQMSESAPATPTANTLYINNIVKAWCKFDVSGSFSTDFNISSVTDNGTGDFSPTFDRDFADSNYVVVTTAEDTGDIMTAVAHETIGVGQTRVQIYDLNNSLADPTNIMMMAIGNQ